jgi:aldose 1-epimerase
MITLTAGECVVSVDTAAGGRIAQITVGEQRLLAEKPDSSGLTDRSINWGLFAMAPWVGRIRQGQFEFDSTKYQLGLNHRDGPGVDRNHAIHGTVFARPWTVDQSQPDAVAMSCPLTGALDWPFEGTIRQRIMVRNFQVTLKLSLISGGSVFPVAIGWHPWFPKPQRMSFEPTAMYERDEMGLPTGAVGPPSEGPWDDCFLNTQPVSLHYNRSTAPIVQIESDCDHWTIFDEPADTTCVEPQSGPPDAFGLSPQIVGPSIPLVRKMSISW